MNYPELLATLAKVLRTSSAEIERIIISAPYRYKKYEIRKRNGGSRTIHHPTPALKAIQRWIVNKLLVDLPVHDCVYSYRRGRNIALHATAHLQSNYISRFDFKDFFPSVSGKQIAALLKVAIDDGLIALDGNAAAAVVRLVCCADVDNNNLALSIGAPSSPHLSNAILFQFDKRIQDVAKRIGGTYTRYADDIYLSARDKETLSTLERCLKREVRIILPFLSINEGKTQHLSRKRRMSVTGVNITPRREISVGRDLKRSIKTRVHLALKNQLPPEDLAALRGMLAHISSVEPNFIERLRLKFGKVEVNKILFAPIEITRDNEQM